MNALLFEKVGHEAIAMTGDVDDELAQIRDPPGAVSSVLYTNVRYNAVWGCTVVNDTSFTVCMAVEMNFSRLWVKGVQTL